MHFLSTTTTTLLLSLALPSLSNPVPVPEAAPDALLEARDTASYPVANDPTLTLIYTFPGPYDGPDPAAAQWAPLLADFENTVKGASLTLGNYPVNDIKYGGVGAYLAFKAPAAGGAAPFTAAKLYNVLKTLEGVAPKKASITIVLTADKSKVVGIGCSSSANKPCVTNLKG